ncbi:MAG: ABC transporter permease [Anaerolineae bacterium]|nr:ABC transporter permease [Anaerolineae bacterium]
MGQKSSFAAESSLDRAFLLVPILLLYLLLTIAVVRGPGLISFQGVGGAIIVAAPLILATFALMAVAVAGRGTVDLAVGPLLGFINVTLVKMNGLDLVTSPWGVFILAMGLGVLYQLLFALIILFIRVQPIIVSLSGFLALSGINLVILPRPGGVAPEWMMSWGLGESIFTFVLLILAVAIAGWLLFTLTPFYSHLRMMGYDERAAYTSGVRIYIVRIGAHCIAGIFVGLAAITYTSLIASGDPTQGTTYTLTAVTALVLGGVSLAGGRGGVAGALLGAVNLFLIGYVLATFNFGGIQAFVTQLSYGVILVAALVLTVVIPLIARYLKNISPFATFVILSIVFAGTMLHIKTKDSYVVEEAIGVEIESPVNVENGNKQNQGYDLSRYRLLPGSEQISNSDQQMSELQKVLTVLVVGLIIMTLVFRFVVVEAQSSRLGPLLYFFIAALILLLFWFISSQSESTESLSNGSVNSEISMKQRFEQ